jgi:hypothetical protein
MLREGRQPLKLDSRKPSVPLTRYLASEGRFDRVTNEKDGLHVDLLHAAEADAAHGWTVYEQLAALPVTHEPGPNFCGAAPTPLHASQPFGNPLTRLQSAAW